MTTDAFNILYRRAAVIAEAETWLRTPFVHQAQVKGAGVGCGTLLLAVYGACGVPVPTVDELGHFRLDWHLHADSERYLEVLVRYARRVERPEPGDIALFKMGRVFSHSAIVVEWPTVIHALWGRTCELADATMAPLARREVLFLRPLPWCVAEEQAEPAEMEPLPVPALASASSADPRP